MLHSRCSLTSLKPNDSSFFLAPEDDVQRTFAMFKPDVVGKPWTQLVTQGEPDENGNEQTIEEVRAADSAEAILERIAAEGFTVVAKKRMRLSKAQAQAFYAEHAGRSFYEDLTDFMSSGPIVALVLEKTNAIAAWRSLIGPTNSNAARAEAEAANPLDDSKWSLRFCLVQMDKKMLVTAVIQLGLRKEKVIFSFHPLKQQPFNVPVVLLCPLPKPTSMPLKPICVVVVW